MLPPSLVFVMYSLFCLQTAGAGGPGLEAGHGAEDLVLEAGAELAEVLLDVLVEVAVEQRVGASAGQPQQVAHHEARQQAL